MKYSQAKQGRIFVIRLEDGDIIHEQIEKLAKIESIQAASLTIIGGADKDSTVTVGPEDGRSKTITPFEHTLDDVHEVVGTGTIFPNEKGEPILHMHIASGRQTSTITGCVRKGVKTWHILEIILIELIGVTAKRSLDSTTGFELLNP